MKTVTEIENELIECECVPTEEFADLVRINWYTPYDGFGYYHDGDIETDIRVELNCVDIMNHKEQYPYVCWYED